MPSKEQRKITNLDSMNSKYIEMVKIACSETWAACKKSGRILYRGERTQIEKPFKSRSPKFRSPVDTNQHTNRAINKWFNENGFIANRSNSIYVSSNYVEANAYSHHGEKSIAIVFPIDGFHYTWSSKISDLYGRLNDYEETIPMDLKSKFHALRGQIRNLNDPEEKTLLHDKYFGRYGKSLINKVSNERRAGTDDMFTRTYKEYIKNLEHNTNVAMTFLGYQHDNNSLAEAMRTGHEIMISGSYYAFPFVEFEELFRTAITGSYEIGQHEKDFFIPITNKDKDQDNEIPF